MLGSKYVMGIPVCCKHLCACLKLLKKQRDSVQSVISKEMVKSEMVCMIMNMVQSMKVKDAKST